MEKNTLNDKEVKNAVVWGEELKKLLSLSADDRIQMPIFRRKNVRY